MRQTKYSILSMRAWKKSSNGTRSFWGVIYLSCIWLVVLSTRIQISTREVTTHTIPSHCYAANYSARVNLSDYLTVGIGDALPTANFDTLLHELREPESAGSHLDNDGPIERMLLLVDSDDRYLLSDIQSYCDVLRSELNTQDTMLHVYFTGNCAPALGLLLKTLIEHSFQAIVHTNGIKSLTKSTVEGMYVSILVDEAGRIRMVTQLMTPCSLGEYLRAQVTGLSE